MNNPKYLAQKFLDPNLTWADAVDTYTKIASDYETIVIGDTNYGGYLLAAEAVEEIFKDVSDKSNVNIVDLACGTGLVAKELKARGFHTIDGVDPSTGMLAEAEKKGCYVKTIVSMVGEEGSTPIADNTYDVAVVSGGMGPNMIPCSGLREMVRIVKPGGYLVNVFREEIMTLDKEYVGRLRPEMERLAEERKWEEVSCTKDERYAVEKPGLVFVHRVL